MLGSVATVIPFPIGLAKRLGQTYCTHDLCRLLASHQGIVQQRFDTKAFKWHVTLHLSSSMPGPICPRVQVGHNSSGFSYARCGNLWFGSAVLTFREQPVSNEHDVFCCCLDWVPCSFSCVPSYVMLPLARVSSA